MTNRRPPENRFRPRLPLRRLDEIPPALPGLAGETGVIEVTAYPSLKRARLIRAGRDRSPAVHSSSTEAPNHA